MQKTISAVSAVIDSQSQQYPKDPLLSPEKAAEYLDVTVQTLAVWRCTKRYDISFIKVGRLVKYRQSALDAFLQNRTHG